MEIVHVCMSQFQHIMVLNENKDYSLILDGYFQTTLPNDEYWNCMLGPNTGLRTVILGGGDMTSIPVLKKRGVSEYTIIELDKEVVNACAEYSKVPRGEWAPHVTYGDAVEALRSGELKGTPHIAVDMLAMSRLDILASADPDEFVTLLTENASMYISGFTDSGTCGIMLNTLLRREFHRRGWKNFRSLINDGGEVFFVAGKEDFELPAGIADCEIAYPIYPKDSRLYGYPLQDALVILKEAR